MRKQSILVDEQSTNLYFKCEICDKEFASKKAKNGHMSSHVEKNSPNYSRVISEITGHEVSLNKLSQHEVAYLRNLEIKEFKSKKVNTCEKCSKEFTGIMYGSGRFCSKRCAKSFATKNKFSTKGKIKIIKCEICNKDIEILKTGRAKKCDNCEKIKKCKRCGIIFAGKSKKSQLCSNVFCKLNLSLVNSLEIFGFDLTTIGRFSYLREFERIKNLLYCHYYDDNMSLQEICDKYNFASGAANLAKKFKSLNIPLRNLSQAQKNGLITGRMQIPYGNYTFKSGTHISWEGIECYYRSSYELHHAQEYDDLKISYRMEELRIEYFDTQKQTYRIAVPDFYLPVTNTIVEIKSSYTLDEQEMKDKVVSYLNEGYNFELYVDFVKVEL